MMGASFLHVGMTVQDMDKTIEFYTKYFGFELEMKGVFSEEFIGGPCKRCEESGHLIRDER